MNIAEILKNCPKGTKLYSPVDGEVTLTGVDTLIHCLDKGGCPCVYHFDGKKNKYGICMLYPSEEQRDWSNFLIPFENGDVIITTTQKSKGFKYENMAIFKKYRDGFYDNKLQVYCQFIASGEFNAFEQNLSTNNWRKATKEEQKEFFEKLHQEGYDFVNHKLVKRFKYGDFVASYNETYQCTNIGIFDEYIDNRRHKLLCVTHPDGVSVVDGNYDIGEGWLNSGTRLATAGETTKLTIELATAGYKWENEKLSKIIKLKFEVGDIITDNKGLEMEITSVDDEYYYCVYFKTGLSVAFCIERQDFYHLAKFDITSLKPYDRVLVRDPDGDSWYPTLVSFVTNSFVYVINKDEPMYEVIPFEGHEHLIGSNEDPDKYYITWE